MRFDHLAGVRGEPGVGREQLGVLARSPLLGVDELVEPVAQTVAVGRGLVVMGAGAGDPEMVDLGLVVAGAEGTGRGRSAALRFAQTAPALAAG